MKSAKAIYDNLESQKWSFIDRARDAAKLTLPFLLPEKGHSSSSKLPTPYQGVGARGVNNLASKLLLALFPPNAPNFRLTIDQMELNKMQSEMEEQEAAGLRTNLEKALANVEKAVSQQMEIDAYRVGIYGAIRHLIVTGNALLHLPKDGGMRVFRMDRFNVKRDPMGNVLQIAVLETVSPAVLPEEVRQGIDKVEDTCDLYTAVVLEPDGKYRVWQEVEGIKIPKSEGTYTEDNMEWIPLRWSRIDGESLGRGFVEEYLGDLISLDGLSKAILEGSVAAARVVFLNNPNGMTETDDIVNAPNGGVIEGMEQDISTLQLNKFNDFRVAQELMFRIEERLAAAFLLNGSVVRNAERVTAEEIRMLSQELESSLGGLYSLLSQELQLPLIKRKIATMTKQGKLPKLPKEIVRPTITTGVEALGRGNDLNRLDLFLGGAQQVVGPEAVASHVVVGEYFKRRATALGVDPEGLVKSDEQLAMEAQQAQQAQLAQHLGPTAMKTMSDQYTQQQELAAQQE